ncbi:GNAT family N-acetyltransferase [Peribacillus sp. NPDC060186]
MGTINIAKLSHKYAVKKKMEMIKLNVFNENHWDSIVKSFKNHDVYYLAGYVKGLEIHGDGQPVLFYYEGEGLRAINVAMKRDISNDPKFEGTIPKLTYFDLITPYGYGGWLIEGNGFHSDLKSKYEELCTREGIVSEFVRFHPVLETVNRNLYTVVDHGRTGCLELDSEELIWSNMSSDMRTQVRKLGRKGVEVHHGWTPELIEQFIPIYEATMDKDNATPYYYFKEDFYKSVYEDLKDNATMFYATYEGQIVSMAIIMFAGTQLHYHLAGTDQEFGRLGAAKALMVETALWGSRNGYKTLHLGGGVGGKECKLFEFKRRFNKNTKTTFSTGRAILDNNRYNELISVRNLKNQDLDSSGFFPGYRI